MNGVPRVVLVPGVLALLPQYAGLDDPVAELRTACLDAIRWLLEETGAVTVVGTPGGTRVGRHLLEAVGAVAGPGDGAAYLVVANGSGSRSERAPGHLDERSDDFDDELRRALLGSDGPALAAVDRALGRELWADVDGLAALGAILTRGHVASVDYDADPFGVQYWVVRWDVDGDRSR